MQDYEKCYIQFVGLHSVDCFSPQYQGSSSHHILEAELWNPGKVRDN